MDYFESKREHTPYPSSPVVPVNDPSLLFANAGMNQVVSLYLRWFGAISVHMLSAFCFFLSVNRTILRFYTHAWYTPGAFEGGVCRPAYSRGIGVSALSSMYYFLWLVSSIYTKKCPAFLTACFSHLILAAECSLDFAELPTPRVSISPPHSVCRNVRAHFSWCPIGPAVYNSYAWNLV